jgi:hypothetical protein
MFFCVISIVALSGLAVVLVLLTGPVPKSQEALIVFILSTLVMLAPQVIIVMFARHRLYAALSVFLMLIFWSNIAARQQQELQGPSIMAIYWTIGLSWVLPLIVLSVAPAKAISRRLIFLAIGLLLLIALNELSKLGLDVTAPKVQG